MTVSNYSSIFFFLTNVRMTLLNPSFHFSPPSFFYDYSLAAAVLSHINVAKSFEITSALLVQLE